MIALAPGAEAQQQPAATPAESAQPAPRYAAYAPLVIAAPLLIDATIRSAVRLKGPDAAGAPPGTARLLVTADVGALIHGSAALPAQISYLYLAPLDAGGHPPRLKKLRVLLFATRVPGAPAQVQLIRPDAQRPWTPAADALVRGIAKELVAPDAPPVITGIGHAFHVPGALPGEGETQIFLLTADNRPISISVLTRPNLARRWRVSLGEIVDEAARPPAPDTLLWYRLACSLPPALPARDAGEDTPENAQAAADDYRFVLEQLGPCR